VARVAAKRSSKTPRIVAAGETRAFLDPLPLAFLEPAEDVARTLTRWGVQTIGAFAQLPSDKILRMLGKDGWLLYQRAHGRDPQPFSPLERPPVFTESLRLEWGIAELEPCRGVLQGLLERLSAQLEAQGTACASLELILQLDPRGEETRAARLRAPTRDARTLLRMLQEQLIAAPPAAPVCGFIVRARPQAPRAAQLSLFGPAALSPVRIATTLASLESLLGKERAGSPAASDGHAPERFSMADYRPPPAPLLLPSRAPLPALLAIRVLRPAIRLNVDTGEGGIPRAVQGRQQSCVIDGRVQAAAGPWHVEARRWSLAPLARRYWDVDLSDGGLYRLYWDELANAWFADGIYD